MNDFNTNLNNIKIINDFKQFNNIHEKIFMAKIDVENQHGRCLYAETCECQISYNINFREYRITFYWDRTDLELNNMKLSKSCSTNF